MQRSSVRLAAALVTGFILGIAFAQSSAAQATIARTVLQRVDDPASSGHEVVMATVDFPSQAVVGRHTHPGIEIGYVLEGAITVEHQGRPSVTKKAGEFFQIDAGAVHDARNDGPPAKILAIYVVDKARPLASPAK
jgi:quercetin dioxygenase-like cupin family protein